MKIVNRETLMSLSPGTVYQEFIPNITVEGLKIKETTIIYDDKAADWRYQDLDSIGVIDAPSTEDMDTFLLKSSVKSNFEIPTNFNPRWMFF